VSRTPWWENIGRCKAKTKKGERCKLPARRPYEVGGRLISTVQNAGQRYKINEVLATY